MKLLEGRCGLVFGVANAHSIAWAIAQNAAEHGANMALSYVDERMARRVRPLGESINAALTAPCDVRDENALERFFEQAVDAIGGRIDFMVHSVAFAHSADLGGSFAETSRHGFKDALEISTYSLIDIARRGRPFMTEGGSILTLSYYGAEKVVGNYNIMGPAKAALEASVRYLAADFGDANIRTNAISAGPIKTLSAAGIPGFRKMLKATANMTPLGRNVTRQEVADAAVFLLSSMASGITGEVLHVDAGFNVMGIHENPE